MAGRIWKVVNDEICGYGNGYRATVYTTPGNDFHGVLPITTCIIYKGDKRVMKMFHPSETRAKRWAETNYLKKGIK